MLQSIRDKSHGLASKIFVGFIVLVFALFGIDSLVGTIINGDAVTSVNGTDISEIALDAETQRKTQELIQQLGGELDVSALDSGLIRQSALNDLIQQELLYQAAENAGMVISSKSLDLQIVRTPDFQVDGAFDPARAQALLQSVGYTPTTYRSTLEREQLLNQLVIAYSASSFVTNHEKEQAAAITLQKRSLRYLELGLGSRINSIEISDSEIEEYYLARQNDFMQEEQVSLEYLRLDKNAIAEEITVTEEEIQAEYDLRIAEYESQIERRASHILVEAYDDTSYSDALTLTEELKGRIDSGESFEVLAAEYSADLGSANDGGDVGYTSGDNFVLEFESALQNLTVGQVSEPVRTEFGYHLIKLTEQSASEIESFDSQYENIKTDLQVRQADDLYLARAEELNNLSFESLDLDDPAEILDLEKQTTALFGRLGGVGIAANASVIEAAFGLEVFQDGLNSELIAIDDSVSVVVRLLEHKPAAIMELAEVEVQIAATLRSQRAQEEVKSLGESMLESLKNGQSIDAMLGAQQLSWTQIDNLQRSNTSISPEIVQNIFAVSKPSASDEVVFEGFQLSSGGYLLVELQNVEVGGVDDFSEDDENNMASFITQKTGADDFSSFLSSVQAKATIRN